MIRGRHGSASMVPMGYRSSIAVSFVVLIAALSGCVLTNGNESAAVDATKGGTSTSEDPNATTGPTAVLTISSNGTQIYSSAEADAGPTDDEDGNSTSGNTTAAGNTTASGNGTSGTTTGAANTTSASSDNETSNDTSSVNIVLERGADVTFDASESQGSNLTFAWSIGNVTSENMTINHTFAEAGTYDVTLLVTDVDNGTDEVTIAIEVGGASSAAGTFLREDVQEFSGGEVVGGTTACGSTGGLNVQEFMLSIIDVEPDGTASRANHIVITSSAGSAALGVELTLEGPDGTEIARGETIDAVGEFSAGDYTITWTLCGGFSTFSDATATTTYVTR